MNNSVYKINKGINKPIEFKGFKAQYIWYLGIGLVALLVLFAVLYIYRCKHLCLPCPYTTYLVQVCLCAFPKLSNKYGEHGMMKKIASQSVPHVIKSYSRKMFYPGPKGSNQKAMIMMETTI